MSFESDTSRKIQIGWSTFENLAAERELEAQHPKVRNIMETLRPGYLGLFEDPNRNYSKFRHERHTITTWLGRELGILEQGSAIVATSLVEVLLHQIPVESLPSHTENLNQRIQLWSHILAKESAIFAEKDQWLKKITARTVKENDTDLETLGENIFKVLRERSTDIRNYFSGNQSAEDRERFIQLINQNRSLRLATILFQKQNPEEVMLTRDEITPWKNFYNEVINWACICPGSFYVAGIENREGFSYDRDRRYQATGDILDQVPLLTKNIPFIVENRYRINENHQRVKKAERGLRQSSFGYDIEGMQNFEDIVKGLSLGRKSYRSIFPSYFNEPVIPLSLANRSDLDEI